ncbi:ABC transporter substrate-binding protein [Tsukamurella pulmonis]|uniref:extracellular solute-binding protein n=1 Tax=Tsukamurella pulmonis TaxID=47312 RepID=UPI000794A855|nr:extracellular solute-binding protein [Tsukamurella pulmonis]KXP13218.1 ABC transporter substrate-binding protein [Tsukamurella pulmonis]
MRIRTLAASLLVTASVALAACSPPGQSAQDSLVVYSNSINDGRGDWLTSAASAAGFTITLVDIGGADLVNKVTAEKNNPVADVAFGLNNVYFEKLRRSGALEPYTPAWSADVDAALGDREPDPAYWPIVREPIMLVYRTAAYPDPAQAPQDWPDLWTQPRFAQRYQVPQLLGGSTDQLVLAGILARHLDPAGELGVAPAGWEAVRQYFARGVQAVRGTDLYARLKDGAVDAGAMWLAGKSARDKQYGITTAAAHPAGGVPFAVQQVALVKGSKRTEPARRFVDWFGSGEVQAQWSQKFFTAPTNTKALAQANAEAIAQTDSFRAQEIDWQVVGANIDRWIEKIQLEYMRG